MKLKNIFISGLLLSTATIVSLTAKDVNKTENSDFQQVVKEIHNIERNGLFPINNAEKDKFLKILKIPKKYQRFVYFYGKRKAKFGDYVEYFIGFGQKDYIFYEDPKRKILIAGSIIDEKTGKNITQEEHKEVFGKIAANEYNDFFKKIKKNAPDFVIKIKGKGDSNKSVVIYTDPQCPFCKRFADKLNGMNYLYNHFGKIYVVEYPLSFHREAKQRVYWILNNVKKAKTEKEKLDIIAEGSHKEYKEILKENKEQKDYSKELDSLEKIKVPRNFGTPTITDLNGNDIRGEVVKGALLEKFHLKHNKEK